MKLEVIILRSQSGRFTIRQVFDVDETICNSPPSRDYSLAIPIKENIAKINRLYDEGNEIVYWTARGSSSGKDWSELTKSQLDSWGCKYTRIETLKKPSFDLFLLH